MDELTGMLPGGYWDSAGVLHREFELAVKQANDSNAIPGWKLEVVPKDDEAKPDPGKNAATALSSDKDVIGVVGTLNTSVSQQVQPVLAAAKIVQVSPANTGPGLTQGANWQTDPKRPYPTYFRTCTTDAVQGPFAARYLYETAKTSGYRWPGRNPHPGSRRRWGTGRRSSPGWPGRRQPRLRPGSSP